MNVKRKNCCDQALSLLPPLPFSLSLCVLLLSRFTNLSVQHRRIQIVFYSLSVSISLSHTLSLSLSVSIYLSLFYTHSILSFDLLAQQFQTKLNSKRKHTAVSHWCVVYSLRSFGFFHSKQFVLMIISKPHTCSSFSHTLSSS